MCQAEPAPASVGPRCVQCSPICPAKLAPDLSDRLPRPAVLGSGSEPTRPQAQDSLTVPELASGLRALVGLISLGQGM